MNTLVLGIHQSKLGFPTKLPKPINQHHIQILIFCQIIICICFGTIQQENGFSYPSHIVYSEKLMVCVFGFAWGKISLKNG